MQTEAIQVIATLYPIEQEVMAAMSLEARSAQVRAAREAEAAPARGEVDC